MASAAVARDSADDKGKPTVSKESALVWQSMPSAFLGRLDRVVDLTNNLRGLHWSWRYADPVPQPQNVFAQLQPKMTSSLALRLFKLVLIYLFMDALKIVAFTWLWWTFSPLADDFARGGLWLLEPLPVSPLRGLLFGSGELWRWYGPYIGWYTGQEWWESGLSF